MPVPRPRPKYRTSCRYWYVHITPLTLLLRCSLLRYSGTTRVLQAATARLDHNAVLLLQLAINPPRRSLPLPVRLTALSAQEPGMPLPADPPSRQLQQQDSRGVGMLALAASMAKMQPEEHINLQMLMQRVGVPRPAQVGNELSEGLSERAYTNVSMHHPWWIELGHGSVGMEPWGAAARH